MSKKGYINVFKKPTLLLVLLFPMMETLSAQMTVAIGEQLHCENTIVHVPCSVVDFNDVAAFTLYLTLDTLEASYISIVNPHAQLAGGQVISNFVSSSSTLIITWQSMSSASITSGKLFDVLMDYHDGFADQKFLENCEIALSDLTVVSNVIYVDGLLIPAISFTLQPQPVSVIEGETAVFTTGLLMYEGQTLTWQQNDGTGWSDLTETPPYSGVYSPSLTISVVPYSLNNYSFRCRIAFENCQDTSLPAVLTVSPLTVINIKSLDNKALKVFPNPCSDELYYEIRSWQNGNVISLVNLLGEVVFEQYAIYPSGSFKLDNLDPGIYFMQVISNNSTRETVKVLKQ